MGISRCVNKDAVTYYARVVNVYVNQIIFNFCKKVFDKECAPRYKRIIESQIKEHDNATRRTRNRLERSDATQRARNDLKSLVAERTKLHTLPTLSPSVNEHANRRARAMRAATRSLVYIQ